MDPPMDPPTWWPPQPPATTPDPNTLPFPPLRAWVLHEDAAEDSVRNASNLRNVFEDIGTHLLSNLAVVVLEYIEPLSSASALRAHTHAASPTHLDHALPEGALAWSTIDEWDILEVVTLY